MEAETRSRVSPRLATVYALLLRLAGPGPIGA